MILLWVLRLRYSILDIVWISWATNLLDEGRPWSAAAVCLAGAAATSTAKSLLASHLRFKQPTKD